MTAWLIDASVFAASVLKDETVHPAAIRFLAEAQDVAGAAIIDCEVANALAKAVRRRRMARAEAVRACRRFVEWPMPRTELRPHLAESVERAGRGQGHPYDLVQVLTARGAGRRFVTIDDALLRDLRGTDLADVAIHLLDAVDRIRARPRP